MIRVARMSGIDASFNCDRSYIEEREREKNVSARERGNY